MAITPGEHFLEWLENKSPFLAGVVFYMIMLPAMTMGLAVVYVLVIAAHILVIVAGIFVAVVILAVGARYLGVELPPEKPAPPALHTSK